jgi:hypothetical protein
VTNFAVKAVTDGYLSCFHDGDGIVGGIHEGSWRAVDYDDGTAWSSIALDYGVSNVVTPEPDLELSVKLASSEPGIRRNASQTAGLYAWVDDPDLPASGLALRHARGTAERLRIVKLIPGSGGATEEVFPPGRVVVVSYEDSDLLEVDPPHCQWPRVSTLRLRSCVVTEELALVP